MWLGGVRYPILANWKERKVSQEKLLAMLVSDGSDCFGELSWKLENYGMETWTVESRTEAADLMRESHPELILTATTFPEGTWSEIVDMARKSSVPANVIVVGNRVDIELYVRAIEYGAYDFMLPPFEADQLSHVLRVATEDVRRSREARALEAVA
jgi:DNA-binding NtrC family response regulator